MDRESFRFYTGIIITFCITSFLWIVVGDYFIAELYCVVNNSFTGEYNKTGYHFPSMIINIKKNVSSKNLWLDSTYKEKYLNNTKLAKAYNL
jgi:hypothetical protein